jgi:hypothetical protein
MVYQSSNGNSKGKCVLYIVIHSRSIKKDFILLSHSYALQHTKDYWESSCKCPKRDKVLAEVFLFMKNIPSIKLKGLKKVLQGAYKAHELIGGPSDHKINFGAR